MKRALRDRIAEAQSGKASPSSASAPAGTTNSKSGRRTDGHADRRFARSPSDHRVAKNFRCQLKRFAERGSTVMSPLDQIKALWASLDKDGRQQHLEWAREQCVTCGRRDMRTWGSGCWCDLCCEEGIAASASAPIEDIDANDDLDGEPW